MINRFLTGSGSPRHVRLPTVVLAPPRRGFHFGMFSEQFAVCFSLFLFCIILLGTLRLADSDAFSDAFPFRRIACTTRCDFRLARNWKPVPVIGLTGLAAAAQRRNTLAIAIVCRDARVRRVMRIIISARCVKQRHREGSIVSCSAVEPTMVE